jgi:hypothetical protein
MSLVDYPPVSVSNDYAFNAPRATTDSAIIDKAPPVPTCRLCRRELNRHSAQVLDGKTYCRDCYVEQENANKQGVRTRKFGCYKCGNEIIVRYLNPGEIAECKSCGERMPVPANAQVSSELPSRAGAPIAVTASLIDPIELPDTAVELTSEDVRAFLSVMLGLAIPAYVLTLVFTELIDPTGIARTGTFGRILIGISISMSVAATIGIVVFFIWVYRVHVDLGNLYPGYSITPRRAIARILVPIYNIWGFTRLLGTFESRLRQEEGRLAELGAKLRSARNWLIVAGVVIHLQMSVPNESLMTIVGIVTSISWLVLIWLLARLVSLIGRALVVKQNAIRLALMGNPGGASAAGSQLQSPPGSG